MSSFLFGQCFFRKASSREMSFSGCVMNGGRVSANGSFMFSSRVLISFSTAREFIPAFFILSVVT